MAGDSRREEITPFVLAVVALLPLAAALFQSGVPIESSLEYYLQATRHLSGSSQPGLDRGPPPRLGPRKPAEEPVESPLRLLSIAYHLDLPRLQREDPPCLGGQPT